jgi:uncharacterized membrane protein
MRAYAGDLTQLPAPQQHTLDHSSMNVSDGTVYAARREDFLAVLIMAVLATGLFAGAAIYINLVEHPARVSCGPELAIREFRPSYRRAAVMQGALAIVGCAAGALAAWQLRDPAMLAAAVLLGLVVPFTLIVIFPTNARLLDPALDPSTAEAARLLARWARLHAVRSVLSAAAFFLFLLRLSAAAAA